MSSLDEAPCAEDFGHGHLGKMAHFLSGFIDLLLKVGQSGHLLLFSLYLLMNDFQVPDLLVQLLLLEC
jgi:hypothetical protein